ncbi:uncharacterized protein HaLaN_25644, partial [Haematococcus lacustris]
MKNLVLQRDWQRGIALHPDEFVVHCCTCAAEQCLYLATSYCDILRVAADTAEQLEEVGVIEGGVAALCWSPDGEVFAAVSGASKLLLMSKLLSVVVTSWARSQPPDLGQALSVIKQAKEQAL